MSDIEEANEHGYYDSDIDDNIDDAANENEENDDLEDDDDDELQQQDLLQREEYEEEESDDDPVAEAEVAIEPSYRKANAIPFFGLVTRLETLFQSKKQQRRLTDTERIQYLLPPKLMDYLRQHDPDQPPESIFPLYRLLLPDKDTSRYINMKERALTEIYSEAFDLSSEDTNRLTNFTSPSFVDTDVCGDFSSVLERVLQRRIASTASPCSIEEINQVLDELKDLKVVAKTGHDWKESMKNDQEEQQQQQQQQRPKKKAKPTTLKQLRIDWLRRLHEKGLSPLEHKWLVRIIQRKLDFGIGYTKILSWYDPRAMEKWTSRGTLKRICRDLALSEEPEEQDGRLLADQQQLLLQQQQGMLPYLVVSREGVEFGTEFDPMRSDKTGFHTVLTDISGRHREFFQTRPTIPLAAKHPAFTVETKLDGERMFVHFRRDGVVRIHSRQQVWYSNVYAPVLGPALRRAVGHLKMDMILDGEVIAWDSVRQETVPFGNNRTIANRRRVWMESHGELDPRDMVEHREEKDKKKASFSTKFAGYNSTNDDNNCLGEECWLMFVAFDILYLGGENATDFIEATVSPSPCPTAASGSLTGLDGFERKKLLHRIIKVQQYEVEIVQTQVIRPNGLVVDGEHYFSVENPIKEFGHPVYTLDSISCCLNGAVQDFASIDNQRRMGRSDEDISQARAMAIHGIYSHTVEDCRQEGLIFKDLSTYYVLGEQHRSKRYWLKFKPDYFNGSIASDLDVVIVGAYFASGLRSAGRPSSFLCACVDSLDNHVFLPLSKVNARSMKDEDYKTFLAQTGYILPKEGERDATVQFGHWFRLDDHGTSFPSFISHRSHVQNRSEGDGCTIGSADYPDLWIDPENSIVVTLNAGEIVISDVFSAGLTLRFPRITKLRVGGDAKSAHDIESEEHLWQLYRTVLDQRTTAVPTNMLLSPGKVEACVNCRFLTETQYERQKKQTHRKGEFLPRALTTVDAPDKNGVLAGRIFKIEKKRYVSFTVLDGRYSLYQDKIDVAVAKKEGWYEAAIKVTGSACVQSFIKKHGGIVRFPPTEDTLLIGGCADDVRVAAYGQQKTCGVIRWTYVFALVARLKAEASQPLTHFEPTILDFLIRPRFQKDQKVACLISQSCRLTDPLMMERALELVQRERTDRSKNHTAEMRVQSVSSWQLIASSLSPRLQTIIAPRRKALWPDGFLDENVVMYPDVFGDDFGSLTLEEDQESTRSGNLVETYSAQRWDSDNAESNSDSNRIRRCLLLAEAMGAVVSTHLHTGVTHVLCNFSSDLEIVVFDGDVVTPAKEEWDKAFGFRRSLWARLRLVSQRTTRTRRSVVLVTPRYVRRKFD